MAYGGEPIVDNPVFYSYQTSREVEGLVGPGGTPETRALIRGATTASASFDSANTSLFDLVFGEIN